MNYKLVWRKWEAKEIVDCLTNVIVFHRLKFTANCQ